jgi:hypothetical protein
MAKVTGPLMSMDASGGFGGSLVFGKWKGRNTVRQLVTPSNPHVQDQEDARNRIRVGGIAQHWANMTALMFPAATLTDKDLIKEVTPSGFAWNGFLVDTLIGKGAIAYDAGQAAFAVLTAPQKTAWDDAADALDPPIPAAYQTTLGGGSTTALTSGNVFFLYSWALYQMGLHAVPGVAPPVYA